MTNWFYNPSLEKSTAERKKPVVTAPTAEKPRHLTVYHSRNEAQNSALILQGKWLEASGFNPGDKVKVVCENGKLIIEKTMDAAEAYKS